MKLEIRNLCKTYGGFRALDGVDLTVDRGTLFGLIGPNGSGKSTLFSVVSGFLRQDAGEVQFDGQRLNELSPARRAQTGMVRTFQVPREFRHLTVRENLMVAAPAQTGEGLLGLFMKPVLIRKQEAEIAEAADEIVCFLGLQDVAHQPSGRLSGGQKKLLELGRALMTRPRLILLDEPFAGVNPVLIGRIAEQISELNTRGLGFIIIEHDLQALSRLVGHLAVMDRGRIIAEGPPDAVLEEPLVRAAYLGGMS